MPYKDPANSATYRAKHREKAKAYAATYRITYQEQLKAKRAAKQNIIRIPLKDRSIPHEVRAKFSAADVLIRPAVKGNGLKAGGAVRIVLSLAGVKDATAKCLGRTPNKLTNALATIKALEQLKASK